jgi:bleomycin hydrolase
MKTTKCIGLLGLIILLLSTVIYAGDKDNGGISPDLIKKMKNEAKYDGAWRAIYNSLLNNEIKNLALDHDKAVAHEDLFNVTIDNKGITNQKSSGRCWLFASLNLLRPAMIEKYKLSKFEFSQNYLAFWDKMEKANKFLEAVIQFRDRDMYDRELQSILKHPFGDGGWWFYTVDLIEKYGCIPKAAMPETKSSSNTGMMNTLIKRKLRQSAMTIREMAANGESLEKLRQAKESMLIDIFKMLTLNLGTPPDDFVWRYEDKDTVVSEPKRYTPQEFYRDIVGLDLKEYVALTDHPAKPRYKMYSCRLSRNMYDKTDGPFMNLPIDSLKAYALRMLLDGQPVVFACDVGKQNANELGVFREGIYDYESVYGTDLNLDKTQRLLFFDSSPNHMMLLVACDTVNGRPMKWKVENSWGTDRGADGYWTLYDEWFDEYTFEIIVHKKYLSKELLKILDTEPIELPPWDHYSEFYKY